MQYAPFRSKFRNELKFFLSNLKLYKDDLFYWYD